jgi:TetR/AcrR family transcriptional repressor of nem operon
MEARVLIPAFAPDLPPLQRLQRFTRLLHAFQQDAAINSGRLLGCPFGNLALEVATSDDIIRRKLQQVFDAIQLRFEHALQDAEAAGELGTIDIPATAQAMLAYIEGVLLIAKTRNDPNIIKRLGPAFADIRIQHTIA